MSMLSKVKSCNKVLLVMLSVGFLQYGCVTPTYLPALGNVKSFTASECDPVWVEHRPGTVAALEQQVAMMGKLKETLKANPSLVDKIFPSPGTLDSLGKAAPSVGSATMAIAGAFTDMSPSVMMANIISSSVVAGVGALGNIRSEDKTQDRYEICMPRKSRNLLLIRGNDLLIINDKEGQSAKDLIEEAKELKNAKAKRNEPKVSGVDTKVDGTGEVSGTNQP